MTSSVIQIVKKKWKLIAIILAAAVLLSVIGIVLGICFSSSDDDADNGAEVSQFNTLVGTFTDRTIENEQDAILAVQDVADDLGLKNAAAELSVKSVNTVDNLTYYRLQQNCFGIPVYGSTFVVVSDENGEAQGLTSNARDVHMSPLMRPTVTQEQVEESIQAYVGEGVDVLVPELSEDMLAVYNYNDVDQATLAYEINVTVEGCPYKVVVNANTADVFWVYSLVYYADQPTKTYQKDTVRKLTVYDADKKDWKHWNVEGVAFPEAEKTNQKAVELLEYVQATHDFYSEVVKIDSFSGEGGSMSIVVDCSFTETVPSNAMADTSSSTPEAAMICFGYENDRSLDTVAHEYTHVVESLISGMAYSGESGAIMEGYSDIFGELVENYKSGKCDWKAGSRNIKNPHALGNCLYGIRGEECPIKKNTGRHSHNAEWTFEEGVNCQVYQPASTDDEGFVRNGEVHWNSTVISHAGYLMTKDAWGCDPLTYEEVAKLWYQTLYLLPHNCTFDQLRTSMEITAIHLNLSPKKQERIVKAFDDVGIGARTENLAKEFEIVIVDQNNQAYTNCEIRIDGVATDWINENYHLELKNLTEDKITIKLENGRYRVLVTDKVDAGDGSKREYIRHIEVNKKYTGKLLQFNVDTTQEVHEHVYATSTQDSTCTVPGWEKQICECGDVKEEKELPLVGHNYVDGKCTMCGKAGTKGSVGLAFALSEDGKSYAVKGIGTCTDTDLVIPTEYNGLPVTAINSRAFEKNTRITSVEIPDSVTFIGIYAFESCMGLKLVSIGNGVRYIPRAFSKCENLEVLHLGNKLEHIGFDAFWGCSSLESVTIPDGVKKIEERAFAHCRSLTSIVIPSSVEHIGVAAFAGCTNVMTLTIESDTKQIKLEELVFGYCTAIKLVKIGKEIVEIPPSAFSGCESLAVIEYAGTKSEWNAIPKGTDWDKETGNYIVRCKDGDIDSSVMGDSAGENDHTHKFMRSESKDNNLHIRYCSCGESTVETHRWWVNEDRSGNGKVVWECERCEAEKEKNGSTYLYGEYWCFVGNTVFTSYQPERVVDSAAEHGYKISLSDVKCETRATTRYQGFHCSDGWLIDIR